MALYVCIVIISYNFKLLHALNEVYGKMIQYKNESKLIPIKDVSPFVINNI